MHLSRSQLKHDNRRVTNIADTLCDHLGRYGYDLLDTPIIDSVDLFLTSAGDPIIARLFTFERHGQPLALRPEFTAAAAYRYASEHSAHAPVMRWQFSGPVFEDDPYHPTRQYQRFSVGAELIGLRGAAAEAEIISMAAHGLTTVGMDGWRLIIGHVGLMRHLLKRYGLHRRTERFLLNHRAELAHDADRVLAKLEGHLTEGVVTPSGFPESAASHRQTIGNRTQQDIARRLAEKRRRAEAWEQIADAVNLLQRWGAIRGDAQFSLDRVAEVIPPDDGQAAALLAEWRLLLELLVAYDIPANAITIQPDLTRAWDYYTGIVFELRTGDGLLIAGGGRYDELVRLVAGQHDAPAVGFAYYVDQLLEVLPPAVHRDMRRVIVVAEHPLDGARWAHVLRGAGIPVVIAHQESLDDDSAPQVVVDGEGRADFRHKSYTLEHIQDLVTDLEREADER